MNKIYYKSPTLLQHAFTSIYGFKLKRKRYNKIYYNSLKNYVQTSINSKEQLRKLLIHLKNNISQYKDIQIDNSSILASMKSLPMTSKDMLREELEQRSFTEYNVSVSKTGGTTGKSLKVYSNENDRAMRMAYLDYIKLQHGIEPFSKRASFTGKEITPNNHNNVLWRYNLPMNQILYASFKLNKENVEYVFNNMRKNQIETIDGFPSSIHLVAKYILSNDVEVDWNIKAVFPTAETLTENVKEDIENAFNTSVIDQYASSEGAPFIFTGKNNKYTFGHETGLFEFYKVDHHIYEMIVTSFINYATPIVRYKIGDRVMIESEEEYLNSIENEVQIEKILGRNSDYLLGNNQNIVTSANMSNVVKDLGDKVIQSQFVQKKEDVFLVNLVVSENYSKNIDEDILINKLNDRLGQNNNYKVSYLSEIPKEKSGKTRFIINEMSDIK